MQEVLMNRFQLGKYTTIYSHLIKYYKTLSFDNSNCNFDLKILFDIKTALLLQYRSDYQEMTYKTLYIS